MSKQKLQELLKYVKLSNMGVEKFEDIGNNTLSCILSLRSVPGWGDVSFSYISPLKIISKGDSSAINFEYTAINVDKTLLTNYEISVLAKKMITVLFNELIKE